MVLAFRAWHPFFLIKYLGNCIFPTPSSHFFVELTSLSAPRVCLALISCPYLLLEGRQGGREADSDPVRGGQVTPNQANGSHALGFLQPLLRCGIGGREGRELWPPSVRSLQLQPLSRKQWKGKELCPEGTV